MPLALPPELRPALEPVFAALPFDTAMQRLVVPADGNPKAPGVSQADAEAIAAARDAATTAAACDGLADRPDLLAGLWLYVDELDRAHALAQADHTPTGSFWHAVVHRREGDFDNARYWVRKTGHHPAIDHIDLTGGGAGSGTDVAQYRPVDLVNRVERSMNEAEPQPALVSQQRKEWKALFEWCLSGSNQ